MDASTRAFHVYGKTESGASALKAGRDGMSTSARRLLILVDGERTIGQLAVMLGVDAVEMGLAQLETLGCVEFLRRFPGADEPVPEPSTTSLPLLAPAAEAPVAAAAPLSARVESRIVTAFAPTPAQTVAPGAARPPRRLATPVRVGAVLAIGATLAIGGWVWRDHVLPPADQEAALTAAAEVAPPPVPPLPIPLPALASSPAPSPALPLAPSPAPSHVPPPVPSPKNALPPAGAAVAPRPSNGPQSPAKPSVPPAPGGHLRVASPPESGVSVPVPLAAAATILHVRTQVTPAIPKAVLDRGITAGHVAVALHVDAAGAVQRVELLSADPPEVYDAAMAQAFGKWTFDPMGIPGRMTVEVDIRPPQ